MRQNAFADKAPTIEGTEGKGKEKERKGEGGGGIAFRGS